MSRVIGVYVCGGAVVAVVELVRSLIHFHSCSCAPHSLHPHHPHPLLPPPPLTPTLSYLYLPSTSRLTFPPPPPPVTPSLPLHFHMSHLPSSSYHTFSPRFPHIPFLSPLYSSQPFLPFSSSQCCGKERKKREVWRDGGKKARLCYVITPRPFI